MKGIRWVELWVEIKANLVAFISISMFVGLGIGLFLGIQWSGVALKNTTEETFDAAGMHDIEVMFPYGITQENIGQLEKVEDVTDVEACYAAYARIEDEDSRPVIKCQTLTNRLDKSMVVEGNLPTKAGEVALLDFWAKNNNVKIGDTITLVHDVADDADKDDKEKDKDGMERFKTDTFTVCGLVNHPSYLSTLPGALGTTTMGTGNVDCVGIVTTDSLDTSTYDNGYTNVFVRCGGLDGKNTFTDEYRNEIDPIVAKVTELGGALANERYNSLRSKFQKQIDDAQKKIDDGEQQIKDGEQKIVDGEAELKRQKEEGEQRLADAKKQLDEGQSTYDEKSSEYDEISSIYNEIANRYNTVKDNYGDATVRYDSIRAAHAAMDAQQTTLDNAIAAYTTAMHDPEGGDAAASSVQAAYDDFANTYASVKSNYSGLSADLATIGKAFDLSIPTTNLPDLVAPNSAYTNLEEVGIATAAATTALDAAIEAVDNAKVTYNGTTYGVMDVPEAFDAVYKELESARAQLDDGEHELDENKATYESGQKELEEKVAEGQRKIDENKKTLEDKKKELADGKEKLAKRKEQFDAMKEYEWFVFPRLENPGGSNVSTMTTIMGNVRWAMALVFVLIGLFVCYSAVSRLVNDQRTQIGAKKALGFRAREISSLYLLFSTVAVVLGCAFAALIAAVVVQSIVNPVLSEALTIPTPPSHFDIIELLIGGGIELVLILLSTWLAIYGMLKRSAVDLLSGNDNKVTKERSWERTKLWKKMSLFSQTVVNNCVNDKRRLLATLVGVTGCTALIVVAVTLWGNVGDSVARQYDAIYDFDTLVYLNTDKGSAEDEVMAKLDNLGMECTGVHLEQLQVRQPDGYRSSVKVYVPTDEQKFSEFYHVLSADGSGAQVDLNVDGVWVCKAYADHMNVGTGDEVQVTESTGITHTFKVAGVFEFYAMRNEFVLGPQAYHDAFGTDPTNNVLLARRGSASVDKIREKLLDLEGYSALSDDDAVVHFNFNRLARLLNTVVLVYLLLSALMALVVLLNLDVMFVSEKKRELIVLMINGFSTKSAKAYIYRDSIALAIIGIILGIILGAVMGNFTVSALEPSYGHFVQMFNWFAAGAGAIGAGVFSMAVLMYSLRQIPRFDLTDINRF